MKTQKTFVVSYSISGEIRVTDTRPDKAAHRVKEAILNGRLVLDADKVHAHAKDFDHLEWLVEDVDIEASDD